MPTDEDINADQDQDHTEDTKTQDQETTEESDEFNARKASKTLAEQNKKLEKRIKQLEKKLPQDEEEEAEDQEDGDIDSILDRKLWIRENKSRIDSLEDDAKDLYETRVEKGYSPEDALQLAEVSMGVTYDKGAEQKKVSSSSSGSVDRSTTHEPKLTEEQKKRGLTPEIVKKYKGIVEGSRL